jgi:large subunit ribosomal protein L9
MEVILLEDVKKVGRKGEVIRVRDGFGRNFLLPRGLAQPCTRMNKQFVEEQRARSERRRIRERAEAEKRVAEVSSIKIRIEARVSDQSKLFGSVTPEQIAEELVKRGLDVEKKHIGLSHPIKTVGVFPVAVEFYPQVRATVTVEVVGQS